MTKEIPGQFALFGGPYYVATAKPGVPNPLVLYSHWLDDEEMVCDECGGCCTSSKECVEISDLREEE